MERIQKVLRTNKGFTLIELLVVIAIIGVLAAVVLASVSNARTKGVDTSVKSNMSSMRTQMGIYYDGAGAGSYGTASAGFITSSGTDGGLNGACYSDAIIQSALRKSASTAGNTINCVIGVSGNSFVIYLTLKSQTAPANYCIDSNGFSGLLTVAPAAVSTAANVSCT